METVSKWRATYAPGRWVVLAGPTSLVIMQPAPAHMAGLLGDLWDDVVSAVDIAHLVETFAAFRVDLMPHFAAFFWTADGMHSLIRGELQAVNVETGEVLAHGEGFHTWNEVGLGGVRQVRVQMDDVDPDSSLELPLVVGVVQARSVTIDATATIPLVLPTAGVELPVAVGPAVESGPEPEIPAIAQLEEPPQAPVQPPATFAGHDLTDLGESSLPINALEDDSEDIEDYYSEIDEPAATAWPVTTGEGTDHDAWGIRDADPASPVGLFVDEDGDGIPDRPRNDLDLAPADQAPPPSVPFEVGGPGFPGFPGAQVAQNQGGFLAAPVPGPPAPVVPPGPPPGWNQLPQDPYSSAQGPGAPISAVPTESFGRTGQPYGDPRFGQPPQPGLPFPNQPFPGQAVPGHFPGQQMPPAGQYAPASPLPQVAGVPSEPSLPTSQDSADGDSTVFSTGIAMTHKPAAPRPGSDSLVLAAVCALGHPNPPGSPACRVCRQPVDSANPRLVHRPVLAQLVTAGGACVELTDVVLIGRAPAAQAGDGNPILLPVPSPNSDISRTHLKVAVSNWEITATDLHSTNGTMVVRPGQAPARLPPGSPTTVEPGTLLDLGDGGVITVMLPA